MFLLRWFVMTLKVLTAQVQPLALENRLERTNHDRNTDVFHTMRSPEGISAVYPVTFGGCGRVTGNPSIIRKGCQR